MTEDNETKKDLVVAEQQPPLTDVFQMSKRSPTHKGFVKP